ncbi:MAG: zinc ribbon domain-containing protein [Lawsonibacter sp.]|nr:zinc ribbon domain-containing protein [Lawsonibacter sp.]
MKCSKCGNEIQAGAKFCPHCGGVNGAAAPGGSGGYAGPEAPAPGSKPKKRLGLLIGGGAALIAVVAALVVVFSGMLASPKGKVEKAFQKSFAAFAQAGEKMEMPDLEKLVQDQKYSQSLALGLNSINSMLVGYDMSALEGLGLRMDVDMDCPDRKMGAEMTAYWAADDLLSFQMLADGSELYFSIPQFMGGELYGLDTKTMGDDLADMTGDESVRGLSFDLFELIAAVSPADPKELEAAVKKANKALMASAEVERTGSETLSVNGKDTKTSVFHMTIPEDALADYVDEMAEALSAAMDYDKMYRDAMKSMGMSKSDIDYIMSEMGDMDVYGALGDAMQQLVKIVGDLELDVYLSNGYVSAVMWEDKIVGSKVEAALYLGGGKEYVDDISLELKGEGQKIVLESSDDHGAKGGVFTDETTIRGPFPTISSDYRYDPKGGKDNFSWEIEIQGLGSLDMEGDLNASKDSLELHLDDISVKAMGMEVVSFQMDYAIGPCKGVDPAPKSARMITEMSEAQLMEVGYEIEANAERWAEEMEAMFMNRLPQELFWDLMYGGYYY